MRVTGTISLATFVLAVVAQPMVDKRDVDVVTEVVTNTIWVDVTTTIYPGQEPTHAPDAYQAIPSSHRHKHGHRPKIPRPQPTTQEAPPAYTPEPPAPSSAEPAPPPPAPSSYEPPATEEPAPEEPTSPSGDVKTGEMTYYDPGVGSCGTTSSSSDAIVALPVGIMNNGANPNANPLCGKFITIEYEGTTKQAEIVDTCQGCGPDDIDLTPSLFKAIAPNGDGRVPGVKWWMSE